MKYYLDTEFIEKPNTIQLISIGIKCEDGREFYEMSSEYEFDDASDWVKENVILPLYEEFVPRKERIKSGLSIDSFQKFQGKSIRETKKALDEFFDIEKHGKPEIWGYYADYDWVVFCWIFGRMIDLPKGFPMYCKDLKQLADEIGKPKFDNPKGEHRAISDAKWNEAFHKYLLEI